MGLDFVPIYPLTNLQFTQGRASDARDMVEFRFPGKRNRQEYSRNIEVAPLHYEYILFLMG